jgi:purine-binding chemotaxis protein CheW
MSGGGSAHLVFSVAGRPCALPASALREVLPLARLAEPPGLPPLLAGFLDLAGTAVAVVRTARLFDLPEPPPDRSSSLLLLREARSPTALLVDEARAVAAVPPDAWSPVPPDASPGGCVLAEAEVAGGRVSLLSAARILLREEEARVAALREAEQRRLDALRAGAGPEDAGRAGAEDASPGTA